jgi:hypothetical protein
MTKLHSVIYAFLIMSVSSFTANATIMSIDTFSVFRDSNLFFSDDFGDGSPPPDGPFGINTYTTNGPLGAESNSRLTLDTSLGIPSTSNVSQTEILVQRARLRTNTQSNTSRGLKQNFSIGVLGIFDLVAPDADNERYSVRLTDFKTGHTSNDNIDIGVQNKVDSNDIVVRIREADFANQDFITLNEYVITDSDFLDYDQIALGLYADANSNEVFGGYSLLSGDGHDPFNIFASLNFGQFGSSNRIFNGENWTRAGFIATQRRVLAVPEPSVIAIFSIGLLIISFVTNRKLPRLR